MPSFARGGIGASIIEAHNGVFVEIAPLSISYVNTKVFGGKIMEISLDQFWRSVCLGRTGYDNRAARLQDPF